MPAKKRDQNGLNIHGNVNIQHGDLVAGDKKITVQNGATYVGGNMEHSNLVIGDDNQTSNTLAVQNDLFEIIFEKIEQRPKTDAEDKEDLKTNLKEIKAEAQKGEKADESFLARRLRNIKRIAPDIAEVVVATLANPAAGFALIVKKMADQAAANKSETANQG